MVLYYVLIIMIIINLPRLVEPSVRARSSTAFINAELLHCTETCIVRNAVFPRMRALLTKAFRRFALISAPLWTRPEKNTESL